MAIKDKHINQLHKTKSRYIMCQLSDLPNIAACAYQV
eukprot:CAMPEP_0174345154 /NCGR_PEP_ID=MMETSP0811_2-20130205/568_1 /TAXON_ID=73025 ORGANISM="Eutreptiella gymnastica-like, Strain CCMP1594" /NCGR_SAMPLE_ID=MMETSP0811_2 /ASSEMBLY_ACC=CAM_ASM_000667 /LENGTH=36 /DNA_ID= /DNA_START= /DNA_END= /DNA_ORIENTATION=